MSLTSGARLGPYQIVSSLGAGGMGEVYRAKDTTLGREVALKILPVHLAQDPERVARFRREAQMLAALNHPLIASIYGLEESGATPVLVLELVEGPTLAERIDSGALLLSEVLPIAHQLSQALEAAHERGIVHRDLKPSNIKLRPDGTVKVLDFGLARALDAGPSGAESSPLATVTSPAVTAFGVVLGTAAYMSPEQACGQPVDRGTDIWAFGVVLFEMVTGARAFGGADPTQTVASVLRSEPDWSRLPAETPDAVRRLLRRCLEKDRRRRLADIRDARLDVEDAQNVTVPQPARPAAEGRRERLVWIGALALVVAAAMLLLQREAPPQPRPRPERRFEVVTPPTTDPTSLAVSPDGRNLAFVAVSKGRTELWVRNLETGIEQPLRGTDGASLPFWSPDSSSIAFFAAERVRRARLDGTAPKVLGQAFIGTGGAWSRAGMLLFPIVPDSPLFTLPEDGVASTPLKMPPPSQRGGHRYPHFLPDDRHFLFFVAEARAVFVGSIDGSPPQKLIDADAAAVFAPPSEVLFVRGDVLHAQRFDLTSSKVVGAAVPLATGVAINPSGGAAVSASQEGTIAYRTGSGAQERQFVWFNRSGQPVGEVGKPDASWPNNPALSPDGRQLVFSRSVEGNTDLWMCDIDRCIPTPLTRQPGPDICPIWTLDGRSIVYSATQGATQDGGFEMRTKPTAVDTEGTALPARQALRGFPLHYSHDGRYLLYRPASRGSQWDLWGISTLGDAEPFPVVTSEYDDRVGQLSPDSRWVAYESNQTGQYEIYVRPFQGPGGARPVSTGGGAQPRWRRAVKGDYELFYMSPDSHLTSVVLEVSPDGRDLSVKGQPRPLFQVPVLGTVHGGTMFEYDVSHDGQRFLINTFVDRPTAPIKVIVDRQARAQ